MRVILASVFCALVATPVLASTDAPAPADQASQPARQKKICRADEPITGTRMGKTRTCKTEADWAEYDAQHADDARNVLQKARTR